MSAKCKKCFKPIGTLGDEFIVDFSPIACRADSGRLVFEVKCPCCGALNHLSYRFNNN